MALCSTSISSVPLPRAATRLPGRSIEAPHVTEVARAAKAYKDGVERRVRGIDGDIGYQSCQRQSTGRRVIDARGDPTGTLVETEYPPVVVPANIPDCEAKIMEKPDRNPPGGSPHPATMCRSRGDEHLQASPQRHHLGLRRSAGIDWWPDERGRITLLKSGGVTVVQEPRLNGFNTSPGRHRLLERRWHWR